MEEKKFLCGVMMRNIQSGKTSELWFENETDRDRFIMRFCEVEYEIVEFLGDQLEFNLDIR